LPASGSYAQIVREFVQRRTGPPGIEDLGELRRTWRFGDDNLSSDDVSLFIIKRIKLSPNSQSAASGASSRANAL